MYAIIESGGSQYTVAEGDTLLVQRLNGEKIGKGTKLSIDKVLLVSKGKETLIGSPYVANAVVEAEITDEPLGDKIIVFKKKRRKKYRLTQGHRQRYTEISIKKIKISKPAA